MAGAAYQQRARSVGEPHVIVLLATRNGARHLKEQLESVRDQTVRSIDILASDDGSTDQTREILEAEASRWNKGRFEIVRGPCNGFAENFRSLVLRAYGDADYYAFSDQDDIWDREKLETARSSLAEVSMTTPALYCGATFTISEDGLPIGVSPIMRRAPSFRNALVQSIAGGNTMVMNKAAFRLLQKACRDKHFVSHDWWAYLIVSGAGGTVIYDKNPLTHYRQHEANLVGANVGLAARARRIRLVMRGQWSDWIETNLAALDANRDLLTAENRRCLDEFAALRQQAGPLNRLRLLARLRLYRQSLPGNISMVVALFVHKF